MINILPNPEMPQLPHLETDRLYLRPLIPEDAPAMFAYGRLPEVAKLGGFPVNQSLVEVQTMIANDQTKSGNDLKLRIYAILDKATKQMIGTINFNQKVAPGVLAMGYVLHPDYWGQGLMPEAGQAMLKLGFEHFACHKIELIAFDYNTQSQKVAKKLGFTQEGRLRQRKAVDMVYRDAFIFGLLAEEWRSRQA
ncbi:GNAT family N-acetyltransferase [Streptococcus moroccensis]|uniref:RimJ/RimL family protein N-acetyltransferase n=1 Tax=Streptococcus moroccensis TaxID=1451356 RepID=A0ABT9YNG6_9STRE|nr:GNAT family protein [Streptococcus moroccensis]MDQ0221530.1 RimJ/RimL family protein N-acetyltransferase [Streptococcus moroccensis]